MIKNICLRLQRLIPVHHSGFTNAQEINSVRKVISTKDLEFRPGVFKGKLFGFTAEFHIDGQVYEVHTTSVTSKKVIDVYMSVDIDGNTIIYTV